MGRFEDDEGKLVAIELKGHTSVVGSTSIDEASTPLDKPHTWSSLPNIAYPSAILRLWPQRFAHWSIFPLLYCLKHILQKTTRVWLRENQRTNKIAKAPKNHHIVLKLSLNTVWEVHGQNYYLKTSNTILTITTRHSFS